MFRLHYSVSDKLKGKCHLWEYLWADSRNMKRETLSLTRGIVRFIERNTSPQNSYSARHVFLQYVHCGAGLTHNVKVHIDGAPTNIAATGFIHPLSISHHQRSRCTSVCLISDFILPLERETRLDGEYTDAPYWNSTERHGWVTCFRREEFRIFDNFWCSETSTAQVTSLDKYK